jgi:hypothetical protein
MTHPVLVSRNHPPFLERRAEEGLAQIPVKSVCRTKIFLKSNIPTPIYGMVKHFDNISEA